MHVLDELQSEILEETIQELKSIRRELVIIRDKVVNRSYVGKQCVLKELNTIASLLTKKEGTLKLLVMIGAVDVEHPSNCAQIFKELKSIGSNSSSPEGNLEEFAK